MRSIFRRKEVGVQGFGNAGSIAAQLFHGAGAKVIAVSDSQGRIVCEQGIDVEESFPR